MAKGVEIINRDIAPGEVFKHTGSVDLQGSIGAGARVEITDGGLKVSGNVGDDANVSANGGSSGGNTNVTIRQTGNSISITTVSGTVRGNMTGVVIRNGQIIAGGGSDGGGYSGIEVAGTTGSRVTYQTDGALELKGDAGDSLRAKADGSIEVSNTGNDFKANAGGSLHAGSTGTRAKLNSGGSLHVEELGPNSSANSGGSSHIEKVATDCMVSAGGSGHYGSIGRDSSVNTGGSLKAQSAHTDATLSSGGSQKIGRRSSNDSDYELSRNFSAAATPAPAAQEPVKAMKPLSFKKPGEGDDAPAKDKPGFNL